MGISYKENMRMGDTLFSQEARDERRKFTRVATNLYITYCIPGTEEKEAGIFVSKDVSGGGILFESFREIPIGMVFNLSIHLPTSPFPLPAKGKVVRMEKTRPYGRYDVGMSLIEISEENRRELVKYLISTLITKADCDSLFGTEEFWKSSIFEGEALKEEKITP